LVAKLPPCIVAMEACCGAHHLGRLFADLVLHTAAYWLMLTVRGAIPKARDSAKAEFAVNQH
jgi:hypothetical protein